MESMLDRPEQELVLVVDDTPDNLLLMRELLEEQYRVRTAGSGPAGLRAAVEEPRPDLILLDVNMPGMDGYEVCRRQGAPLTASGTLARGAADIFRSSPGPAIVPGRTRSPRYPAVRRRVRRLPVPVPAGRAGSGFPGPSRSRP